MPSTPIPAATDKPIIAPALTPPPPPLLGWSVDVGVPEGDVLEAVKESEFVDVYVTTTALEDAVERVDEVESDEDEDEEELFVGEEVESGVEEELDDEVVEEEELLLDELDELVVEVVEGKVVVASDVVVGSSGIVLPAGPPPPPSPPCRTTIPTLLLSTWGEGRRRFTGVSARAMTSNGAKSTRSERGASRITGRRWETQSDKLADGK